MGPINLYYKETGYSILLIISIFGMYDVAVGRSSIMLLILIRIGYNIFYSYYSTSGNEYLTSIPYNDIYQNASSTINLNQWTEYSQLMKTNRFGIKV